MAVKAAGLREPEFIGGEVDLRINIYRGQVATNNAIINANGTKNGANGIILSPNHRNRSEEVKYYNEYELKKASKEKREPVLIHQFSSYVMRHTGCTNMARSGVNIKAAQYIMGHAKSDITLDVYNLLNNRYGGRGGRKS